MTSTGQATGRFSTNGRLTSLICEHCGRRFRRGEHFVCSGSVVSGK